jgi:hypothetical protein
VSAVEMCALCDSFILVTLSFTEVEIEGCAIYSICLSSFGFGGTQGVVAKWWSSWENGWTLCTGGPLPTALTILQPVSIFCGSEGRAVTSLYNGSQVLGKLPDIFRR